MVYSRQAWLESLDPRLRAVVEADLADYEDTGHCVHLDIDEGPDPAPIGEYGMLVEFTHQELHLISRGLGRDCQPIRLMKEMLLERARKGLAAQKRTAAD